MPIDPVLTIRFPLLDGIRSIREGYGDAVQRAQIQQFESWIPTIEPPAVPTSAMMVAGLHGPVPVRVYNPPQDTTASNRPCLVWMHGGGFLGGDMDMAEADWTAREICARAGAVVVSVDYRLAVGGVSYPVPHDDVVAVVRWARTNAAELQVDAHRLTVGGASAGGNLAAGAVLRLRDDDNWQPRGMVLSYPMLHPLLPPSSEPLNQALQQMPSVLRMRPSDAKLLSENYLGGPVSSADGFAMPGLGFLEGLCPTLVLNAEYDALRASGEAFTASLALAGVDVRQVTVKGMLHAFLNLPADIEPVRRALDLIADMVAATSADAA